MGCVFDGNYCNLVLLAAVQEGQDFAESNKISTTTVEWQKTHIWQMICSFLPSFSTLRQVVA